MPVETFTLPNGLRVVCEPMPAACSVAVGVYIGTGSRDEQPSEYGVSHFIEHILFKGTLRRDSLHIVREIEGRGGYINAETDKEYTAFYARVLPEDLSVALDVLSDMLLSPRLDPEDIEREKRVVIEELRELMDYPEEYVYDLFAQTLWSRHPLAHPVIGTAPAILALDRSHIRSVMERRYVAPSTVVSVAGQVDTGQLLPLVERFFGNMPATQPNTKLRTARTTIRQRLLRHPTQQVHFCLGTAGYNLYDERKYTLAVLDTLLGGNMSSRLFQEVREKRGLVYQINTSAAAYREGGYFAVHANCSPDNYAQVLEVIHEQLRRVCEGDLSEEEVQRAKHQLRGSLLMSTESVNGRMSANARSVLFHRRVITVHEIIEQVEAVGAGKAVAVAQEVFGNGKMALAAIGRFSKTKASSARNTLLAVQEGS
ncbi:MAG: pitrilysin family protein [Armatimonadota bacterium]|nr:insulinase family protein [bacterium]MDW8320692.1 pitrilysin family protein [Armatimonadota bacterium]